MRRPNTADDAREDVRHERIWATPESAAGILTVAAGQRAFFGGEWLHHHIWVLDGEAELLGSALTSGSYVHVEPGVRHALDASATLGCTVFHILEQDGVRVSAVVAEGTPASPGARRDHRP